MDYKVNGDAGSLALSKEIRLASEQRRVASDVYQESSLPDSAGLHVDVDNKQQNAGRNLDWYQTKLGI